MGRTQSIVNLAKHGVAFEDAATVFLDPSAMTFSDPDHSIEERREITIGYKIKGSLVFVSHCEHGDGFASSVLGMQPSSNEHNMSNHLTNEFSEELRDEYDLSTLDDSVRGKYYKQAVAGSNLVLIDPDLAAFFPDAETVNRALRVLADAAQAVAKSKPQDR